MILLWMRLWTQKPPNWLKNHHCFFVQVNIFRASIFKFLNHYSTSFDSPNVNVHVDETPITRRHGNIGRRSQSNTVWVIGAVDIFNKKCVLSFLPSRGHAHIFSFIDNWIARGTTITTDCLAIYTILSSMGFLHNRVNHSRYLVAPDGTNTNRIEGSFGNVKTLMRDYKFKYVNAAKLNLFMAEWWWRYFHEAFNRNVSLSQFFLF